MIISNHHVIQNAQSLDVTLADGNRRPPSVVGINPDKEAMMVGFGLGFMWIFWVVIIINSRCIGMVVFRKKKG